MWYINNRNTFNNLKRTLKQGDFLLITQGGNYEELEFITSKEDKLFCIDKEARKTIKTYNDLKQGEIDIFSNFTKD